MAPGVGSGTFHDLIARFGTATRAMDATLAHGAVTSARAQAAAIGAALARRGARLLTSLDDDYPGRLRELTDPPPVLFALGALAACDPPVVAVVGTRDATPYGERVTRAIAASLARSGACILSGLARGIDAAAHRAALEAGGRTAAVLGTGIDVPYPAAHRALHETIAHRGLLLSEHAPGERATAGSFPRRNRIIAALADVTIVVEAGAKSGALITAGHALDLGRTVAAVPGPIDAPASAGSNELLRDGAVLIASPEDALALAGLTSGPAGGRGPAIEALTPDDRAIWDALTHPSPDLDTLSARSRLPARRCLTSVTALELAGLVSCELTGEVRRR